jgi:hypothetical protein
MVVWQTIVNRRAGRARRRARRPTATASYWQDRSYGARGSEGIANHRRDGADRRSQPAFFLQKLHGKSGGSGVQIPYPQSRPASDSPVPVFPPRLRSRKRMKPAMDPHPGVHWLAGRINWHWLPCQERVEADWPRKAKVATPSRSSTLRISQHRFSSGDGAASGSRYGAIDHAAPSRWVDTRPPAVSCSKG